MAQGPAPSAHPSAHPPYTQEYPSAPTPGYTPAYTQAPAIRSSRGRWRTALVVMAVAALLGGAAGLAAMKYAGGDESPGTTGGSAAHDTGSRTSQDPSAPTPSASGSTSDPGSGSDDVDAKVPDSSAKEIPDGWHRVHDPEGFSLVVPDGWTRQTDGSQIDYTPDDGLHRIRISLDPEPDFDNSYAHMLSIEKDLAERLPGYERQTLHSNTFRDRPGSLWEFTWVESKDHPGPRRGIDQMYYGETGGPEYALYMTGPEDDWQESRDRFDTMLRSWQPPGAPD